MILDKQHQEARKVAEEKIMELALRKNLTYTQAKKLIDAGQSSLSDFKFR